MRWLLDTSAFLWFIAGDPKFSDAARREILRDGAEVFLSSASVWEIAVEHGLGKLPLPSPVVPYIRQQRDRQGFQGLPLSEADVEHLSRLPAYHRDPFDRMLICQCIEHGLRLITPDPLIAVYPVAVLW